MIQSQNQWCLDWLKRCDSLTPLDALRHGGILRLSARILDLRRAGHLIITETLTLPNGKRVAQYHLLNKETSC